jgi:hypothetical protein
MEVGESVFEKENISTVTHYGVEWINPYSETTYQITNPCGTAKLIMAYRGCNERLWVFIEFDDSSDISTPPEDYDEFFTIAQKFIQE